MFTLQCCNKHWSIDLDRIILSWFNRMHFGACRCTPLNSRFMIEEGLELRWYVFGISYSALCLRSLLANHHRLWMVAPFVAPQFWMLMSWTQHGPLAQNTAPSWDIIYRQCIFIYHIANSRTVILWVDWVWLGDSWGEANVTRHWTHQASTGKATGLPPNYSTSQPTYLPPLGGPWSFHPLLLFSYHRSDRLTLSKEDWTCSGTLFFTIYAILTGGKRVGSPGCPTRLDPR